MISNNEQNVLRVRYIQKTWFSTGYNCTFICGCLQSIWKKPAFWYESISNIYLCHYTWTVWKFIKTSGAFHFLRWF